MLCASIVNRHVSVSGTYCDWSMKLEIRHVGNLGLEFGRLSLGCGGVAGTGWL